MRCSLWSRISALLVVYALCVSTLAFAQEPSTQTRPRRVQSASPTEAQAPSATQVVETARLNAAEPLIRIGLATEARSASISTTGQLLNATEELAAPVPLPSARIRLEPRLLSPLPPTATEAAAFRVEITGAATRTDAERASREIREMIGQESDISYEEATKTWRMRIGPERSGAEAEELRARLEEAGFANARVVQSQSAQASAAPNSRTVSQHPSSSIAQGKPSTPPAAAARTSGTGNVRLTARSSTPTRELVAYSTGRSALFSSRAPVVFASDDEQRAPVRFNDKPYRGRLEVFTNMKGTLTVVNVLRLEDYVRGVVPNELSPGGYPAIEALKAQAVAARTYAFKNRGQFATQGFDLLPTTRSQVYGGLSTEHPLSTRAVEETRGIIATFDGEPINALYTSTCGGRTEDAANIFAQDLPYLRGRECAPEGRAAFLPFTVKTSREPSEIREEQNVAAARDAALLFVHNFELPSSRLTDGWLAAPASISEVKGWLSNVARLARQAAPPVADDATRPPAFASALALAVYGESRADTLFDNADVEYLLSFRDAAEIPARNRADVALL
ncbi:MAG TPA: SpoIID/LytB domain-containing protein, partial [Pyrinomonadaceae bacterium]